MRLALSLARLVLAAPSLTRSRSLRSCENKFDLLGCAYNMPAAYEDGVFNECDSDLQSIVGTYVGTDGKTSTWSQPESLPATSTLPWTPVVPSSSNCRTYQSTDLFPASLLGYQSTAAAAASSTSAASSATSTGSAASSRSGASSAQVTGTGAAAAAQSSGGSTSGASHVVASGGALAFVGALVAALV